MSRSVEADGVDDRRDPGCVRLAAGDPDRQHDVLRRGHRRQQVERLEDEADLVPPQQGQRLVVERGDLGVAEVDLARRRPVEAGEHVQQGRLAGARRSHDRGELAGGEADTDVVERGDGRVAGAVELADVLGPGGGRVRWLTGCGLALVSGGHVVLLWSWSSPRSSGVLPAQAHPAGRRPIGLGARHPGGWPPGTRRAIVRLSPTPGVRAGSHPARPVGSRLQP